MEKEQIIYKPQSIEAMQKQLKNPIDPKFVKVRVGARSKDKKKGIALFYLDAREVRKVLDNVIGCGNWETSLSPITSTQGFHGFTCSLTVHMPDGKKITKTDAGEPSNTSPIKGAASDALKRAASQFGVGAYLYYIPNTWYNLTEFGTFETEPQLPEWAKPQTNLENWEDVAIMEYDPTKDIDLEALSEVEYTDKESEEILKESRAKREEIINKLKAKK